MRSTASDSPAKRPLAVGWVARLTAVGLVASLFLALAGPTMARPTRGCGNSKFEPMTMDAFRRLSQSLTPPVPDAILFTPEWEAGWAAYDKNDDGTLCVKDKPDTSGHLGSWVWNVVDNTANH